MLFKAHGHRFLIVAALFLFVSLSANMESGGVCLGTHGNKVREVFHICPILARSKKGEAESTSSLVISRGRGGNVYGCGCGRK